MWGSSIDRVKCELWFTKREESGLEEGLGECRKSVGKKNQKYSPGAGQHRETNMEFVNFRLFLFFFFWDCFTSYVYIFTFTLKNVYTCHTIESSYMKFRLTGIFKVQNSSYMIVERSIGGE